MIKRFENETENAFIYRVCENKGTEGLGTWEEVADYLNEELGHDYSSSKYRKAYQYTQTMIDANKEKFFDIDAQIEELEIVKEELRKERIKLQTANIERNRIERQDARYELFYEQIGQYIKKAIPPQIECVHVHHGRKKYILTISDVHDGVEFVSSNNEYSPKIVEDRFAILLDETVRFIRDKGIMELTVLGLGDWIQGILRVNDLRANDTTVVKSCVHISNLLIDFLNKLSAYVEIDYYDVAYGNHSEIRYLGTKANAMMDEDLGYIIAHYIEVGLSNNNRVRVHLPKEDETFVEIDGIFDFEIIACHGHQIKDINSAIKDLSMQRHKFYNTLIMGHFHAGKEQIVNEAYGSNVETLIAPAFIGSDPYSDTLFMGAKAGCNIYGFEEVFGHTETYKIILN